MQHECARELKTGGWHWVGSHTTDCRARGCEPHDTKEEAQNCQYEYELAGSREMTWDSAHPCVECLANDKGKIWTDKSLQLGGYMGQIVHLCDDHRTVDVLRKHTKPPVDRWVS